MSMKWLSLFEWKENSDVNNVNAVTLLIRLERKQWCKQRQCSNFTDSFEKKTAL